MDVPAEILEVLKCSRCENYLLRGPVYLQYDGAAVCGTCFAPERPAVRNTQYEATARLLKFPCKYWELGCLETVPYVGQGEEIAHEAVCEYREYVCPVFGSAHCDWLGTRREILQHCQTEHRDKVVHNPATLVHDISKSSVQTYVMRAFNLIFLLHAKVCLTSGKIFHSLRFMGASEEATKFSFDLDIRRRDEQLSKTGQVAPQGCLAIQEPTSVAVNTNSLLNVLGGFDGATFTVTVKRRVLEKCALCAVNITVLQYRDDSGWRCELCAPAWRACKNQRCTYTDISSKCGKHESYFCQQRTWCFICSVDISRDSLSAHYDYVHQDITPTAGSTWLATKTGCFYLLSSVAGTAVCWYQLTNSQFDLNVYIPVLSARLSEFRCEVQITDSTNGHARTFTPDALYDKEYDWHILVKKEEFPSWTTEFDVSVDIRRCE